MRAYPVFISGFSGVIIQCVLLRELLTVFAGNELVLGAVFAVWLLACSAGSYRGSTAEQWRGVLFSITLVLSTLTGFIAIRLFPTFVPPGSVLPPPAVAMLLIIAEVPVSFLTGYVFGSLSKVSSSGSRLYLLENCGGFSGALLLFGLTLFNTPNAVILGIALQAIPAMALMKSRQHAARPVLSFIIIALAAISTAAAIIATDHVTAAWKYAARVDRIVYTREGELAVMVHGRDTTYLLNNSLYKSTMEKRVAEQAVHIPLAQRDSITSVLIIFDRGHSSELVQYPGAEFDVLETIPQLASGKSIVTAPEKFHPDKTFGCILLGAPLPENTGSNRFYTVSFFRHCKSLLSRNGIFSYTLPFSEGYMPMYEQQLYTVMLNTLKMVFTNVLVFPGEGHSTFMASDSALSIPTRISVSTAYLSAFTLPALSEEKVRQANATLSNKTINTTTRPVALLLALKNWMRQFGYSGTVLLSIVCCILIGAIIMLPKTHQVMSVSTSGFVTGLYTVGSMLLYQAVYGSLYADISILMLALSAGFVAGSFIRRFPFSDTIIGIYAPASIALLTLLSQPPAILFMLGISGAGFLSAAQFVTRRNASAGILNAADLIGGVFGMALSSTLLIPLFGIMPVMVGVCILKLVSTAVSGIAIEK